MFIRLFCLFLIKIINQQKRKEMKRNKPTLEVRFSGYGHYKVTTTYYGKQITCITTDMPAIDAYKDGKVWAYWTLRNECIRDYKGY